MNTNSPTSTKQSRRQKNRRRRLRKNLEKKVQKKVNRAAKRPNIRPSQMIKLSDCAKDYARAITNPFGSFANLPCIPDFTVVPSQKLQVRVRGVFSTGAQGVGWVTLNPFVGFWNDHAGLGAHIDQPVMYTQAGYNHTNFNYTIAGGVVTTPGVVSANSNSPFSGSVFLGSNWSSRLVAAGLKCRYMGSDFRNQGSVYLYQSPGNTNIQLNADGDDLLQSNYTVMIPVARKTEYVFYQPKRHDDTFYAECVDYQPSTSGTNNFCMLIFIEGGDITSPQNWSFEATMFYELTGEGLTLSPSHSDPNGYGAVLSVLPNTNPTSAPETVTQSVLSRVGGYIGSQISAAVNVGVPILANRVMDRYLGGGVSMPPLPTITEV